MSERVSLFACCDIPEANRAIPTPTCKRQPIRTEMHAQNIFGVSFEGVSMCAGGDIPEIDVLSIPTCERQSIFAETDTGDKLGVFG